MSLRDLATTPHFATSTTNLVDELYVPALSRSTRYDRGVGYFTSNWLRLVGFGLGGLARNGGHARIVASPMLAEADCLAIQRGVDARSDSGLLAALDGAITDLESDLATDTLVALAWMIADGLLDFRVALPTGKLDGDFHDKFGIFADNAGNAIAFHGSPNDSAKAFRNYESISVYYSWLDDREASRVRNEQARFNAIWDNRDPDLRVYTLPEATQKRLIEYTRNSPRPYARPTAAQSDDPRWRHQKEARDAFLQARSGVLEMATGTGKTRTALSILGELEARNLIDATVVAAFGTDLLDQWYRELIQVGRQTVYRAYAGHREMQAFLNAPQGAVLLVARTGLRQLLKHLDPSLTPRALLICDEVHGMGSSALAVGLKGRLKPFGFKLGLSATPERTYDQDGNAFIHQEIGPVIFRFGLREAIERGILCEFEYIPLPYALSEGDKVAIRQAIKRHHGRTASGDAAPVEALYRDIARVRKLSREKLQPFEAFVESDPSILDRCIIFVETAEYGALVQPVLMRHRVDFHTYYQDDDRDKLRQFARGTLDCLLTCHRISEGIDIQSANNIVLFASSRAPLETVQRLGRCLRIDPANPHKRARVLDFVELRTPNLDDPGGDLSADEERSAWFSELAAIRRDEE